MKNERTNVPDWSALIPVVPQGGPRGAALYAALRDLIEQRRLPPGSKLPTTRDLAQRLKVSRGAAVAAFERLVAEGFAEARVGAGTFVAAQVPHRAGPAAKPAVGNEEGVPSARSTRLPALPGELGMAAQDEVTLRIFRRLMMRHLLRPPAAQFAYGDPQGDAGLRAEITSYLQSARGVRCTAEQVVLTAGSQGALDLIARGVLQRGQKAWVEDPGYPMAGAALEGAGVQLVPVPVDGEGLDLAAGLRLAPSAAAVYVTPSHQFPTGVALTMARRMALIDWAAGAGAWIIEDDYDSEFRHAGPPLAAMQGMDGRGRVIYVGTFSKAIFPGLRLGYLVLPPALVAPVLSLRERTDRAPPMLGVPALTDFLREGHFSAHLRRARRRVDAARAALLEALEGGPSPVVPPSQGLHVMLSVPPEIGEARAAELARQAGLGVRRLSVLSRTADPRQGLVIGVSGAAPEELAAAARRWVTRLGRALRE